MTLSGCRKPNGTEFPKIVAPGYRVYFSGDCSGFKGKKEQHGVRLVITEEIVKKAGKDGITIACISAHLLKARRSIKSNLITFMVAYAPTEEAAEGQKTKYMAALSSTLASMPTQKCVLFWPTRTPGQGRQVREAGKQSIRCWAHKPRKCQTVAGFRRQKY